jgi:hypothetical protein
VSGIDSDGVSLKKRIEDLLDGLISDDERGELFTDLCRDGMVTRCFPRRAM